jgi:Raf kinase inhibitor-like YbhB/YbcL family protein
MRSSVRILSALTLILGLAAWDLSRAAETPGKPEKGADMTIQSTAFAPNGAIPKKFTGEGEDVSPALSWSNLPPGTKELALICDDPDAPTPQPWVHWVIYKIPADAKGLDEGIPRVARPPKPAGAVQGPNTWDEDNIGYRGPMPPKGHGVHHYHFKLYALDAQLDLAAGLDKEALLKAIKGHVLATAQVTGTYQR